MSDGLIRIAVLLFLGILLASLPLVGCDGDEGISIEKLTEGITAAYEDVESYQFNISSGAEGTVENDESNSSTEIDGMVDNVNKKMQIASNTEVEGPQGSYSMEFEQYLVSDMKYTKAVYPGESGQWMKEPMTLEDWEGNLVMKQIELLEGADIEILGSEGINGAECWAIKLLPSLEKYLEIIGEETGEFTPQELSERLSIKQWFAKETYYLMKAEMEWTIVDSWGSSTTRMEIDCSHYNEPVYIELPAEAEEAETDINVVWHVATYTPHDDIRTEILEKFAEKVIEMSEGQMEVRVHPGGELFTESDIFEGVSNGMINIAYCQASYYFSQMPMTAAVLSNPWSFDIEEITEARKVLVASFTPAITEAQDNNIMHLMWIPSGYIDFFFNQPVTELADITGLKVAVPDRSMSAVVQAMGAEPVAVEVSDIYLVAQTGLIDGAILGLEDYTNLQISEVLPYAVISGLFPATDTTLMNEDAFMDLSLDLREIVQMSAIETELEAFQLFSASYTEVLAGIGADTDINVYYLTEAQQQDWWDNAINPALQGMMEDVLGDELATAQQIAIRAIAIYIANH